MELGDDARRRLVSDVFTGGASCVTNDVVGGGDGGGDNIWLELVGDGVLETDGDDVLEVGGNEEEDETGEDDDGEEDDDILEVMCDE